MVELGRLNLDPGLVRRVAETGFVRDARAGTKPLSTDLDDLEAQPYFVWDREITYGELGRKLQSTDLDERTLWMARVMREARYQDVFKLLRLADVLSLLPRIERHLGRSRAFWQWLIEGWRADGLIPRA